MDKRRRFLLFSIELAPEVGLSVQNMIILLTNFSNLNDNFKKFIKYVSPSSLLRGRWLDLSDDIGFELCLDRQSFSAERRQRSAASEYKKPSHCFSLSWQSVEKKSKIWNSYLGKE